MRILVLLAAIVLSATVNGQKIIKETDLIISSGKYINKATGKLFSGKIATYFTNGNIEQLVYVKNGVKTGKNTLFFNSGLKRVVYFEDENHVNYGKTKLWHENGDLLLKGYYVGGKLIKKGEKLPFTGLLQVKYTNGNNYEEVHFKDGYWHGEHTRWDRNGKILFECIFENNKIVDCPIYNKN